jgi:hypothetical protein|uniref:Uncharacterized protein n=2 Tax=Oryza TaxID=4527 RepID=A0A0E0FQ34_ORYNI
MSGTAIHNSGEESVAAGVACDRTHNRGRTREDSQKKNERREKKIRAKLSFYVVSLLSID